MALLPDSLENLVISDEADGAEEIISPGTRRLRKKNTSDKKREERSWEKEGQQRQQELARRAQQAAERQKKRDALKLVGAWVDVVKINAANRLVPGGDAIDLTHEVLTQLKWVSWNFKKELPNIRIHKIEYVLNPRLYRIFEQTKNELRRHRKSTKEMLLFHGSTQKNVNR
jgi:hypothetical protein